MLLNDLRSRCHNRITGTLLLAFHPVRFVVSSRVLRTVKSRRIPTAGLWTQWLSSIPPRSMHPGVSHLTHRSTARTGTRECSLQTQTVQSVPSPLAAGGPVGVETQLQCAVTLHPLAVISAASFLGPSSRPILMMQATCSFFAMSMVAVHGAHSFSITVLQGKL